MIKILCYLVMHELQKSNQRQLKLVCRIEVLAQDASFGTPEKKPITTFIEADGDIVLNSIEYTMCTQETEDTLINFTITEPKI